MKQTLNSGILTNNPKIKYRLSVHAKEAIEKRQIRLEWLERAINQSKWQEIDLVDSRLTHKLAVIPEFGGRVLRVIVDALVNPVFVVTIFFDRRIKEQP